MNKKGFTLIELLAVIVILGVIMTIVVVAVTGSINNSRDETFTSVAKNYAEAARNMRAKEKLYYEPKSGEAVLIPYSIISESENLESNETSYGTIIPSYSFISIVNSNGNYSYFVNQADDTYHIFDRKNANSLSTNDILAGEDPIALNNLKELTAPLTSFSISYGSNNYQVKAVGVEFSARYSDKFNGTNPSFAEFDLKERNVKFKGTINMFSDHLDLSIVNNELGDLDNTTYTFKEQNNHKWVAVDGENEAILVNGKELSLTISFRTDGYNFDLYLNNTLVYENVFATTSTTLYGYFTKDTSYVLSNALVKGNISVYDGFAQTGKFQSTNSNTITIKGINYSVSGSKLLYVVVKK